MELRTKNTNFTPKKILLALLPYWDPFIPPNGIATLKGFLQTHGYEVKTIDVVIEDIFQYLYKKYFETLGKYIPGNCRGNFYNIGHDVLRDQMMAHVHFLEEKEYIDLTKIIVSRSFYINSFTDDGIRELIEVLNNVYQALEDFMIRRVEEEKPDVLGLTAYRNLLPACMFVFKLIKERYPNILTVMGGSLFSDSYVGSDLYNKVIEKTRPYLDKIIVGEGEILFLKLLRGELPDSPRVYRLQDFNLEGLDFSERELPDYSDFDISFYPYLPATGSTSCPYQCSFCNSKLYWGKYRQKKPQQIVGEMAVLYKKYNRQLFLMTDCLLNTYITELSYELLKSELSFYYDCFFRIDEASADIKNTILWRRGGLYRVRLGVETGSQKVLDLMHKKITVEQITAALSALAYAGIKTTAYMVVGHPGETEEDFQMTLDFLEAVKDDLFQVEFTPFTYSYAGLNRGQWDDKRIRLFPEEAKEMLIFDRWILDCYPSHEEMYRRLYRTEEHCKRLNIPNPYSLQEHFTADERWKRLHKNAVPSLIAFREADNYINENKSIKSASFAKVIEQSKGDFCF
jgi:hypothetical protein